MKNRSNKVKDRDSDNDEDIEGTELIQNVSTMDEVALPNQKEIEE